MAKRSNNSTGKPYDPNNSFVRKMATKVGDLMPQGWISKWLNSPRGNGDVHNQLNNGNQDDQDVEEESQPPSKRPRIRMDITHPPGTFSIEPRNKHRENRIKPDTNDYNNVQDDTYHFLQPSMMFGSIDDRDFVSSTPAGRLDVRNNPSRSDLNALIQQQKHQEQQQQQQNNGVDDNSESSESTSGCSSLIPQNNRQDGNLSIYSSFVGRKKQPDDKLSFTNHLQTSRSFFSKDRESMNSRRPSFNPSIVNNNDSSLLDRSAILSSPFYSGNITFGGSNAIGNYRSNRGNQLTDFQLKTPRRNSIRVKPSNSPVNTDVSGMSQTAKRILEALEQFSSPISDAKKIPVKSPNSSLMNISRKRSREDDLPPPSRVGLRHLTRELAIPTVPELLSLKRRQKLQDTTLAARKIISAQSEPPPTVSASSISNEYQLRTEEDNNKKFLNKLRTKSKKKIDDEDTIQTVNLTNIPLPITNLPNFVNTLTPLAFKDSAKTATVTPATTTNKIQQGSNININNKIKSNNDLSDTEFKFSSPIRIPEANRSVESINQFKFSEPKNVDCKESTFDSTVKMVDSTKTDLKFSFKPSNDKQPSVNFVWQGSSTAPRPKKKSDLNEESSVKSSELKAGSVLDILMDKSDKIEKTNVWECGECYIKNNDNDLQCVACKARKSSETKKSSSIMNNSNSNNSNTSNNVILFNAGGKEQAFTAKFKLTNDKWECNACLDRDPVSETKCLACTTPKEQKKIDTKPSSFDTKNNNSAVKTDNLDKLKPAEGSWECPGCMLINTSNVITCPCCNASKPGLIKETQRDQSKLKDNDNKNLFNNLQSDKSQKWTCPSCYVPNKLTDTACVCCSTPSPSNKSANASKSSDSKPKLTTLTSTSGFGDKFKQPVGSWSCNVCLVHNKSEDSKCVSCGEAKPGAKDDAKSDETSATKRTFIFGIPSQSTSVAEKTDESKNSSSGFKFGVLNSSTTVSTTPTTSTSSSATQGFVFRSPKSSGFSFTDDKNKSDSKQNDNTQSTPKFSFGIPKTESVSDEKAVDGENKSTLFSFSATKPVESSEKSKTSLFSTPSTVTNLTGEKDGNKADVGTQENQTDKSSELSKPVVNRFAFKPATSSLGSNTETIVTKSQTNNLSFTFSDTKAQSTSSVIGFGQTATATNPPSTVASTGFTFTESSQPSEKKPAISLGNTSATPLFGMPSTDNKIASPFNSTATTTTTTPTSNAFEKKPAFSMDNSTPAFGSGDSKPATPAAAPNFDTKKPLFNQTSSIFSSPTTNTANKPAAPIFGSSTNNTSNMFSSNTSTFVLNQQSATTPAVTSASTSLNMFSSVKTENTGLFSFGSSNPSQSTSNPGGFNFNGSNANKNSSTAAKPLFDFGSNASTTASTFGTPNFGASTSNTSAPGFSFNAPTMGMPMPFGQPATNPVTNIFGGNNQQSTMGQIAPPVFSSEPTTNTGFNFGAQAPATGSSSSGFNFSAGANPQSGGFNFEAPAPISFDPNVTPTFNFTKGSAPTAFNATPQAAAPAGRKIKKAVRRIPPRT